VVVVRRREEGRKESTYSNELPRQTARRYSGDWILGGSLQAVLGHRHALFRGGSDMILRVLNLICHPSGTVTIMSGSARAYLLLVIHDMQELHLTLGYLRYLGNVK